MKRVRTCPACGNISERLYRCDDEHCGADLVYSESQVWEWSDPTVDGYRDDGLVRVNIPIECIDCERTRYLPLPYRSVGRVIRLGCPGCSEPTKHRPVGDDLRRAAAATFNVEVLQNGRNSVASDGGQIDE